MSTKTPACLIGAGALGHTWVATRIGCQPPHEYESIACQASYGADVVRALDELEPERRGNLYERIGRYDRRQKWVKRTRAYALLDQPTDGRAPYEPAIEEEKRWNTRDEVLAALGEGKS